MAMSNKGVTNAPKSTASGQKMSSAPQGTATNSGSRPMGGRTHTATSGDMSVESARRVPGALS